MALLILSGILKNRIRLMNKDVIEIISKRPTSILFQHDDYLFSSYLVDQLMALCDKLEAGASADRWREIDEGCCASCAGGVMYKSLLTN